MLGYFLRKKHSGGCFFKNQFRLYLSAPEKNIAKILWFADAFHGFNLACGTCRYASVLAPAHVSSDHEDLHCSLKRSDEIEKNFIALANENARLNRVLHAAMQGQCRGSDVMYV
jgi:hypothetical protein